MNKDYQKPDFEYISLILEEIATDDDDNGIIGGITDVESSVFG